MNLKLMIYVKNIKILNNIFLELVLLNNPINWIKKNEKYFKLIILKI